MKYGRNFLSSVSGYLSCLQSMYQLHYGVPPFPSLAVLLSILNKTLNNCRIWNTGLLLFIFPIMGVNADSTKGEQIKVSFLHLLCFCISTKISGSRADKREPPVLLIVAFLAVMFLLAIAALLCFCGIRAQHERNSKPGIIHHLGPGPRPPRGSDMNEL